MRILAITNQQNTNKSKNPNFGAFRSSNGKKTLRLVKELLGEEGFPLAQVLQKGENIVKSDGFTTVGQYLSDEQIAKYLKRHPHTRLEKDDIITLTTPTYVDVRKELPKRLDEILKHAPRLTVKKMLEVIAEVREARSTAQVVESRAKRKLGF